MKHPLVGFFAFALVTTVWARAESYSYKEPFDKSAAFGATGIVVLENVNGDVEVQAWDKNEIRISGEKSAKTEEELKAIQMTIDLSADRAVVKVKLPKRESGWFGHGDIRANVHFTLRVPAGARLDGISTVNGGVDLTGLRGGVRAHSVNGHVKATDITGSAKLSTVNGRVEARIVTLPTRSEVEASSTNGAVTLALPADVSATLRASTVNGGIDCEFPLEVSGHFVGRNVHGTIGGGGSSVKASTVNGAVKIRKI